MFYTWSHPPTNANTKDLISSQDFLFLVKTRLFPGFFFQSPSLVGIKLIAQVLHQITTTEMMATTSQVCDYNLEKESQTKDAFHPQYLQVAEEAGKQGFWDKLRNTFVRD